MIEERSGARDAFSGLSGLRRNLRWDDLDALYFAGYAMWNYLNIPFLFDEPGFETEEGEPMEVEGETWRRLDVNLSGGGAHALPGSVSVLRQPWFAAPTRLQPRRRRLLRQRCALVRTASRGGWDRVSHQPQGPTKGGQWAAHARADRGLDRARLDGGELILAANPVPLRVMACGPRTNSRSMGRNPTIRPGAAGNPGLEPEPLRRRSPAGLPPVGRMRRP